MSEISEGAYQEGLADPEEPAISAPWHFTTSWGSLVGIPTVQAILDNPWTAVVPPAHEYGPADLSIIKGVVLGAAVASLEGPACVWRYLVRAPLSVKASVARVLIKIPGKLDAPAIEAQAKVLAAIQEALKLPSEASKAADPEREALDKRLVSVIEAAHLLSTGVTAVVDELKMLRVELERRVAKDVEIEKLGAPWSQG